MTTTFIVSLLVAISSVGCIILFPKSWQIPLAVAITFLIGSGLVVAISGLELIAKLIR